MESAISMMPRLMRASPSGKVAKLLLISEAIFLAMPVVSAPTEAAQASIGKKNMKRRTENETEPRSASWGDVIYEEGHRPVNQA